ncbi:type I-E CRISPR-associated protein Cse1/CasA [Synechococcus elongatus]|uniref:type I-E CRISPR-associated protein Cse1/CasA n=1 Tax=Synechococcus elongatus TaxID=32046 RepID=UPI0030D4FC80
MKFNLCHDPWIPVIFTNGDCQDVSLDTLFRCADQIERLQTENPPTTLAILRFLLALLHFVYRGPVNPEHWEEIKFDKFSRVREYLSNNFRLFELFDPLKPFFQDPSLPAQSAAVPYVNVDLHPDGTGTVFNHQHRLRTGPISPAKAARALLRLQFFDVPGLKSGHPKGGSNRSAVSPPLLNMANIWVCGHNLAESLLLNLMQYSPEDEIPSAFHSEDLPAWERETQPPTERLPDGYCDYLTFQYRRVRLIESPEGVTGIVVTKGNSFPEGGTAMSWECHQAIKEDRPLRLSLDRQLWRDANAFLQGSLRNDASRKLSAPRILNWLAELAVEDLVPQQLHLSVLGFLADKAKPLAWTEEQFSAPLIYLQVPALWQALDQAVTFAESHQQCFRTFKGSPYACVAEAIKDSERRMVGSFDGSAQFWAALNTPFEHLLQTLPKDCQEGPYGGWIYGEKALPLWRGIVQKSARKAFTDSIQSIQNPKARAEGLRSLNYWLFKLRDDLPVQFHESDQAA